MPNQFLPKASQNVTQIRPSTWNRLSDAINAGAIGTAGLDGGGLPGNWVNVKNTSGSDRERFDCMQLDTLVMALTTNGQVDPVFEVKTAAADKTPAILLEPIANNQFGRAVIHGFALAKLAAGTTTLRTGAPDAAHNVKPDGSGEIKLLAAPNASAVTLCPVLLGAGGSTFKIYKYTLTADMGTSATANLTEPGGTTTASGVTLNDTISLASWQVTGDVGLCYKGANGQYYVIVPECEPEEISGSGA